MHQMYRSSCLQSLLVARLLWSPYGREVHSEHIALHSMELRRTSSSKPKPDVALFEIDSETQRFINVTIPLDDRRSEYTGLIDVGTTEDGGPQFQANVVFDTGSTNLWVVSSKCHNTLCRSSNVYDPKKSLTAESFQVGSGTEIDIKFGTGELAGPLGQDTFRVGPMKVTKQPFALIKQMTGSVFTSFHLEGILGLGFPSLSIQGVTPFFDHVMEQQLLEKNEFAFYMNIDSSQPSALLWGGIDKNLFHGPIRMFPVVQEHYWALELVDFRLGGKSLVKSSPSSKTQVPKLIVDSGTTYFSAPGFLFEKLQSELPAAPCSTVEKYKPLTFVLRDAHNETYDLEVGQQTYMVGSEASGCKLAVMQLDVKEQYGPAMLLGEVFMRHFFTVFSRGNGKPGKARVGFAHANLGAKPSITSSKASQSSLVQRHTMEISPLGIPRNIVRRED